MFETAEVGATLSDAAFREMRAGLRFELIDLQQRLRQSDFSTIVILAGVKGAGIIDTVNLLNTWMDPRWIATTAYDDPSDEERERPKFWRYWRTLPAAGTIGLYPGGWYQDLINQYCARKISRAMLEEGVLRIKAFEHTLAEEGTLIIKLWLHVSKAEHRRQLDGHRKDPLVGFRASDRAWVSPKDYNAYVTAAGHVMRETMDGKTPWFIIEGGDDNYRRATVLGTLRDALRDHLDARRALLKQRQKALKKAAKAAKKQKRKDKGDGANTAPTTPRAKSVSRRVLDTLDMSLKVSTPAYAKAFHRLQLRLHELQSRARKVGMSSVMVFEGWDAAGKGGAIRRLTFAFNSKDYLIVPIAAPTDEERGHHYLWRFWRHLGRSGRMIIFDRSWYGRVLVERVERLIDDEAWMRGYAEINDFEEQLALHGTLVIKFWLHLTKKEQLRRFEKRKVTPYKRWKITDEDWRNREKWELYEAAVNDMVSRTSTASAPWHLIPANDKNHTRLKVLETVAATMEKALRGRE